MSNDAVLFQRFTALQTSLVDALDSEHPIDTLCERLAHLCGATAGIISMDGTVQTSTGVLPFVLFRETLAETNRGRVEFEVAGWQCIAASLPPHLGQADRWLLLVDRSKGFVDAYVRTAIELSATLIRAASTIDVLALRQEHALQAAALREALELSSYDSAEAVAARLAALGVDFSAPVYLIEAIEDGTPRSRKDRATALGDRLRAEFGMRSAQTLVAAHKEGVTLLVQAPQQTLDDALRSLGKARNGLLLGVGRVISHPAAVSASHHDATLAVRHAERNKQDRVVRYEDFDFSTRLLADVGREKMLQLAEDLLEPLKEKPILLEALIAYFDNELDVMKTAKELFIHHNSLRYRLTKIEELVGGSLRSASVIASLHLALSAHTVTGEASAPIRPQRKNAKRVTSTVEGEPVLPGAPTEGRSNGRPGAAIRYD